MQDLINYFLKHTWVRFIIAGGTSAFVDLTLLFVLSEVFKVYYLLSDSTRNEYEYSQTFYATATQRK
jgi:putative flippase GtrA